MIDSILVLELPSECSPLVEYSTDQVVWNVANVWENNVWPFTNIRIRITDTDECCYKESTNEHWHTIDRREFTMDLDKGKLLIVSGRFCKEEPPTPTPREDCAPRYKDVETLLAKANCICTNIGVKVVQLCNIPEFVGWQQGFVIVDRCIPEDSEINSYGSSFHVIMVVLDPNYLLQTIECICGGRSDPEYLPLWNPN